MVRGKTINIEVNVFSEYIKSNKISLVEEARCISFRNLLRQIALLLKTASFIFEKKIAVTDYS